MNLCFWLLSPIVRFSVTLWRMLTPQDRNSVFGFTPTNYLALWLTLPLLNGPTHPSLTLLQPAPVWMRSSTRKQSFKSQTARISSDIASGTTVNRWCEIAKIFPHCLRQILDPFCGGKKNGGKLPFLLLEWEKSPILGKPNYCARLWLWKGRAAGHLTVKPPLD